MKIPDAFSVFSAVQLDIKPGFLFVSFSRLFVPLAIAEGTLARKKRKKNVSSFAFSLAYSYLCAYEQTHYLLMIIRMYPIGGLRSTYGHLPSKGRKNSQGYEYQHLLCEREKNDMTTNRLTRNQQYDIPTVTGERGVLARSGANLTLHYKC